MHDVTTDKLISDALCTTGCTRAPCSVATENNQKIVFIENDKHISKGNVVDAHEKRIAGNFRGVQYSLFSQLSGDP